MLRSVTKASLATSDQTSQQEINNDLPLRPRLNSNEPPPLSAASDELDTEAETEAIPAVPQTIATMSNTRQPEPINGYPGNGITEREHRLIEKERLNRATASTRNNESRFNPVTSNSEPVEA